MLRRAVQSVNSEACVRHKVGGWSSDIIVLFVRQRRKKFDLFSVDTLGIRVRRSAEYSGHGEDVIEEDSPALDTYIEMMNSNNSAGHCVSSLSQHPLIICSDTPI